MLTMCDTLHLPDYWDDETGTFGIRWWDAPPGDPTRTLWNFSGHNFELEFRRPHPTVVRTKTTGITGGDGGVSGLEPNVLFTWQAGDFTGLSGYYELRLTNLTTGQIWPVKGMIRIKPS
jgi:hypothetical protein